MLIALLFFCISGAVILQVFAAANSYMLKNRRCDSAALCAQACAEVYSAKGNISEMLSTVFGKEYTPENGVYTVALDNECLPSEEAAIVLTVHESTQSSPAGILSTATADFTYMDECFYSLSFSVYTPTKGGSTDG